MWGWVLVCPQLVVELHESAVHELLQAEVNQDHVLIYYPRYRGPDPGRGWSR